MVKMIRAGRAETDDRLERTEPKPVGESISFVSDSGDERCLHHL